MTHNDKLPLDSASSMQTLPKFLASVRWWDDVVRCALAYAPNCMLPAVAMSAANIVMMLGMHLILSTVNQSQINLDDLMRATITGIVSLLVGLVLTCWSVAVWLFRCTAFSRALLTHSSPGKAEFAASIAETKKRTGYLAKLWFVVSLILLLPVSLLCVLITLNILTSPNYIAAGVFSVSVPGWALAAMMAAIIFLAVITTGYSLVALVVSSISSLPAKDSAIEALRLSTRYWLAVIVITGVMLLINSLIATPQALLGFTTLAEVKKTPLFVDIGLQVWLGLTSTVLWPLTTAPFCDLLRDKVK